ncbi:homoserine kinase [Marinihelvus fidelis]|uniref:Homoserine kinase n=1 Tax=Marinihelvus fidelis TaxID=2613842 RepID=A0A5N0T8Y3_9GAMM|nr:homoserine kinase [Marinihelvus fidelis]KAA9131475.1 homoserine kinase [Marinihelvus fidelis]
MKVFAPASTGNVSVGFDSLGLALQSLDGDVFGDVIELQAGSNDDWLLDVTGPFADALPPDPESNIVMASCRRFERMVRAQGKEIETLKVRLDKRLPVGSGLGSSASSIVAALVALNRFFGGPLNRLELLELMARMEGEISGDVHLDNIAPSLLGGLRLCMPDGRGQYALPWPGSWQVVVAWPGTRLETKAARDLLPERLRRETAVAHGANFARFVHELYSGDPRDAAACLVDLIAEPWRKDLIPGFEDARAALMKMGALAFGISGSGPTVFCVVDNSQVGKNARAWLEDNFLENERGFVRHCRADLAGARALP